MSVGDFVTCHNLSRDCHREGEWNVTFPLPLYVSHVTNAPEGSREAVVRPTTTRSRGSAGCSRRPQPQPRRTAGVRRQPESPLMREAHEAARGL